MEIETKGPVSALSYIEPHEENEAEKLIEAELRKITGKPGLPHVLGYLVAIKVFVRPSELKTITRADGSKVTLHLPDTVRDYDKFTSGCGLVVGVGPQAYKGNDQFGQPRFPEGAWCKVGDWVVFPRFESALFMWRGIAMVTVPDEKVCMTVAGPEDVEFGYTTNDQV